MATQTVHHPFLFETVQYSADALKTYLAKFPDEAEKPDLFFNLLRPWIVDQNALTADQVIELETTRKRIIERSYPAEIITNKLVRVLSNDQLLRESCVAPIALAFYLNSGLMPAILAVLNDEKSDVKIQHAYNHFEAITFTQGSFRRIAYTHIFNLRLEAETLHIDPNVYLRTVPPEVIPELLNEKSLRVSFLHPQETGNVFFVSEQEGVVDGNDYQWLLDQRKLAMEFCTILQYYKDGIVNIGYTSVYFNPPWVNSVRKPGIFFHGSLRRSSYKAGQDPYTLDNNEFLSVMRWAAVTAHPPYKGLLEAQGHDLRSTIERAGTYYEASLERTEASERVVSLAIALEALFSPGKDGELRYRISQNAAILLGQTPADRQEIFKEIRKMYDLRSTIVHGAYDVSKHRTGELVSEDDLRKWGSYLRRGILAYMILLLRGHNRREDLLALLRNACFDDSIGDKLRAESDTSSLVNEFISSQERVKLT